MRRFAQLVLALTLVVVGGGVGLMSVAAAQPSAANGAAANYQGLWWNAPAGSESGWGINFAHQADTIFATWFTYDTTGYAWWLSMTANKTVEGTYSGTLLRTSGPAFNAIPFDPTKVTRTPVGTGTLIFSDADTGRFAYTVEGVQQTKTLTRQVFGPQPSCLWSAQPNLTAANNYQDLWWVANGAESGWGVNLTHQGDAIFATWFTYGFDGSVLWFSATAAKGGEGVYTGTLYRTTGPPFNAQPFDPDRVTRTPVGRLTMTFTDGNTAAFAYTVAGITQRKTITRQLFVPPAGTLCSAPLRVATALTVASPTASPWVGETVQLSATVRDQFGYVIEGAAPTWSSSNPGVATISANGALQGQATGPVVMTARAGSVSGSVALNATPMPRISVAVGTTKEVVFRWATDRCDDWDLVDQPARFVRAEDGSLVLFAVSRTIGQYLNRGADFGSLKRVCTQPVLVQTDRCTAESYENWEWLWSVYREGDRWHALIHNEYHDPIASTCKPGDTSPGNPCWYNSITYAVSTDGARSFSKPAPPAHVVAPAPGIWIPPPAPVAESYVEGYRSPSNIVRGTDGYYYALVNAISTTNAAQWLCVLRTDTLGDPASWRAWDGNGFNLAMTSPYATGHATPPCADVKTMVDGSGLTYNTYLGRYVHVDIGDIWVVDRFVCGVFFALSPDLIHWSRPELLVEANLPWCSANPQSQAVLEPVTVSYPSIVDHGDTTSNLERTGQTPHLYYARFNDCCLDRDLVRVPLTFTRVD
jgi:hypothetical protein